MIEIFGDFWTVAKDYDAICCTTNGVCKSNGDLVMGAGIALAFKQRYPEMPKILGELVGEIGNNSYLIVGLDNKSALVSFPTKNHWKDQSDIDLIVKSAKQLVAHADTAKWEKVLLSKPGCGLGGLNWKEVKPILDPILDNRFTIISHNEMFSRK